MKKENEIEFNNEWENEINRLALLQDMPMTYSGLVVENTTKCNAKCGMCYQSAGPKGSDVLGLQSMSTKEVSDVIADAISIETLYPRFHLSGGEAFLNIEECLELFDTAHTCGFLDITTTTNAYWAKDKKKALHVCKRLRDSNVSSMEISWDIWHTPYINPECINHCLEACYEVDIETNLRLLSTKSHSYDEAIALLKSEAVNLAGRITAGPVFATGRAKDFINSSDFHTQGSLYGNCHSVLNLTVNPLGNVYPCCAGIDQTDNFVFGNIREMSIRDIAVSMNNSPLLRTIVFGGISSLLPIVEKAGINIGRNYNSICHLCWTIFSRKDCVEAIKEYFSELQRKALLSAIEQLEKKISKEVQTL